MNPYRQAYDESKKTLEVYFNGRKVETVQIFGTVRNWMGKFEEITDRHGNDWDLQMLGNGHHIDVRRSIVIRTIGFYRHTKWSRTTTRIEVSTSGETGLLAIKYIYGDGYAVEFNYPLVGIFRLTPIELHNDRELIL